MKHTKGPWRWWPCRETEKPSDDYIQIAAGLKHVAQVRIASINKHDMRLIAVAPELIEACKAWLDDETDDGTFADVLRLIIAKATGGES
jgi:hypothetical protein